MIYTRSNREKDLMRRMLTMEIPFYCPMTVKEWRSPQGRKRQSFSPLFNNYVFSNATVEQRYSILTTNCVSSVAQVCNEKQLQDDLRNLEQLINSGAPVTLEEKLAVGQAVRVKSGPFKECRGIVIQRRAARRLLVSVNFLKQGVSVELEDFAVEPV